ncbi:hypothetical protein [Cohnella sp. 56]|uniref:hypothetical protein n=1 Tax=Cohnella sp. 56 TaxID=3113722 RepID=UPI0030E9594E
MRPSGLKPVVVVLALGLALAACAEKKEGAPAPSSASASAPTSVSASHNASASADQRPEHLPKDFPIPADAKVSTSHSEHNEGKKSALLIFTTQQSMSTLSETYKNYFATRIGDNAAQTIDENNLIIQGDSADGKESWSLIGSPLASREGVVELTLTWAGT